LHTSREPLLRKLFSIFLALHGLAHLVGINRAWTKANYTTELFDGRVDLGTVGGRIDSVIWLLGAAAFVVAAILIWQRSARAVPALLGVTAFSTLLCITAPRNNVVGLVINVILLAGLAVFELRSRRQLGHIVKLTSQTVEQEQITQES
jgi:asparagine N-glycosylation enzyme membrane subunit Stt3